MKKDFWQIQEIIRAKVERELPRIKGETYEKIYLHRRMNSLGFVWRWEAESLLNEPITTFMWKAVDEKTGEIVTGFSRGFKQPQPSNIEKIIDRAKSDPNWFDAAKGIAISMLTYDQELPRELAQFSAQLLSEEIKSPKRAGRKTRPYRTSIVIGYINMALSFGLAPTRNDEGPEESACDAVAYAFRKNGLQPSSFSGVKSLWLKRGLEIGADTKP